MPTFQGSCCHDHDCGDEDCGTAYSLYRHVDTPRASTRVRFWECHPSKKGTTTHQRHLSTHALEQVTCLNEETPASCQRVFKPWEDRLNHAGAVLRSQEDDPELLLYVPFDGAVTLKAVCVIGGGDGRGPSSMRVRGSVASLGSVSWSDGVQTPPSAATAVPILSLPAALFLNFHS